MIRIIKQFSTEEYERIGVRPQLMRRRLRP